MEKFGPDKQWNFSFRLRDYKNFLAKLSSLASKVAAIVDDPAAAKCAENLFAYSCVLEERRTLFDRLRSEPNHFIEEQLKGKEVFYFSTSPLETRCSILSSIHNWYLSKSDPRNWAWSLFVAWGCEEGQFNVGSLGATPQGCTLAQNFMVQAFTEKVAKRCARPEFISTFDILDTQRWAPWMGADASTIFTDKNEAGIDFHTGWTFQNSIDLFAMRVVSKLLVESASGDGKFNRETRFEAEAVWTAFGSLSNRLRNHMRVSGGGPNHLRAGYQVLEKLMATKKSVSESRLFFVTTKIKKYIAEFEELAECETSPIVIDGIYSLFCCLADEEDDKFAVRDFALVCNDGACGGDAAAKDAVTLIEMKDKFLNVAYAALARCLEAHGFFQTACGKLLSSEGLGAGGNDVFTWLAAVADTFTVFELQDAKFMKLLQEVKTRAELFERLGEVMSRTEAEAASEKVWKEWVDIWSKRSSIRFSPPVDSSNAPVSHALKSFCSAADTHRFEDIIVTCCRRVASGFYGKPFTAELVTYWEQNAGLLPPAVGKIMSSCRIYWEVQSASEQLNEGRAVGVLQLSDLISDASSADASVKEKQEFGDRVSRLKKQWSESVLNTLEQTNTSFLKQFAEENEVAMDAIKAWDFSKAPWLVSDTEDAERTAKTRKAEFMVVHASTTKRIWEELVLKMDKFDWAETAERELISKTSGTLPDFKLVVDTCRTTIAALVMTHNVLSKSGSLDNAKKYVVEKLGLSLDMLPDRVREKAGLCKSLSAPQGQAAEAVGASASISQPPKKKLKVTSIS